MKFLEDSFDIIIIGAGAAGITAAWNLSKENSRILCLEQGPYFDKIDFKTHSKKLDKDLHFSPNVRKSNSDYPVDDSNSEIGIANYNSVGGSTILYSAHLPRFHPSDFKIKYLDKVGFNWPFEYRDVEKYYEINDRLTGVSGIKGDNAYPEGFNNLLPPLPIGKSGELLAETFNKLGWHWWPSYSGILSKNYLNRKKFKKAGHYNMILPYEAKSSIDNTYLPLIKNKNFKLLTNSRAIKLTTNVRGKIEEVIFSYKKKYIRPKVLFSF